MLKKLLYGFSIILMIAAPVPSYASEWVQESEKDGIKVFTRQVDGSNVREFKGEIVVNCNIKKVNTIVDDVPNLENWMSDSGANCLIDTFNLQPNGCKEMYLFGISTSTFGVSYRCGLFYSKVTISERKIIRTIELAQESQLRPAAKSALNNFFATLPLKKNGSVLGKSKLKEMVYFTEMHGMWIFDKLGENQTKVTWIVKTNPGGRVPVSLANTVTKNNPYATLKGLRTQIK